VNVFLSYPSARREVALRLKLALEAEQHEVFFDRDDLGAGEAFHAAIRQAVQAADLMVFLVAPESVKPGSYALSELELAQARWPRPAGHVLPVVVAPTHKAEIPAYLMAVTLLEPRGDIVAETLAAVSRLSGPAALGRRRLVQAAGAAALALALAGGGAAWWWQAGLARQQARAQAERTAAQVEAAARTLALCQGGSAPEALQQLQLLAARTDAPPQAAAARDTCVMQQLRQPPLLSSSEAVLAFVAPLKAQLVQSLAQGAGLRAEARADLHAHLGRAEVLLWLAERRPDIDPLPHLRQALQDEPANPWALAFRGHWRLLRGPVDVAEAQRHFTGALAALRDPPRDRPWLRGLQLAGLMSAEQPAVLLQVLDAMRQGGEPAPAADRRARLWSRLYAFAYRDENLEPLLAALPAAAHLQTLQWLFGDDGDDSRARLRRHVEAVLLQADGRSAEARRAWQALREELRRENAYGQLLEAVERRLAKA
jgi:TIR domain